MKKFFFTRLFIGFVLASLHSSSIAYSDLALRKGSHVSSEEGTVDTDRLRSAGLEL
jgi:hypothetical protein